MIIHPILKALIRTKEAKNVKESGESTKVMTTKKEIKYIDMTHKGIDLSKVS